MKAAGGIAFVLVIAVIVGISSLKHSYKKAATEVCDLIDTHYYRRDSREVERFIGRCRQYAKTARFSLSKSENIRQLNALLSGLRTSHLSIYDPDENRQMWENQGLDTGLRSRFIEGDLVVFNVIRGSPADLAGVKPGDVIVSLNDELISPIQAQVGAGVFIFNRFLEKRRWHVEIKPAMVTEDMRVSLRSLGAGRGLMTIPSFLSQYFENPDWQRLASELKKYKSLVIDVRGNAGGSFPAMLRALSPFRCDDPYVGRLFKSDMSGGQGSQDMLDSLDAESQVRQLASVREVLLRGFENYGCFRGPVVLLVDSGSSSVTEIFAHALLTRRRAEVMGHSTAGQVVMARWFPIPSFGSSDYQIAIPIAGYETTQGHRLEDNGVHPRHFLDYDLRTALKGQDSWIAEALRVLQTL